MLARHPYTSEDAFIEANCFILVGYTMYWKKKRIKEGETAIT